jgi:hypothetical protein
MTENTTPTTVMATYLDAWRAGDLARPLLAG